MNKKKLIYIAPLAILGLLAFMAIGGWIVQLLWNWLLPPLFAWPPIGFWQALGLLALCRILFGGAGAHGPRSNIRRRMAERMDHMTLEDRERFRESLRRRFGFGASAGESKEQ